MPHEPTRRSALHWLADCVFVPLALLYTLASAALGCSVSIDNSTIDPNRALGNYDIPGAINESASSVFFGYWLDGDSGIDAADGQAFQRAIGTTRSRARVSVVPQSILYEETTTEVGTGRTITVSISGTWTYDGNTRLRANWGAAIVTATTFPATPTFALAAVGTRIQDPQPNDLIFANNVWTRLSNVSPGPLDGVFNRVN